MVKDDVASAESCIEKSASKHETMMRVSNPPEVVFSVKSVGTLLRQSTRHNTERSPDDSPGSELAPVDDLRRTMSDARREIAGKGAFLVGTNSSHTSKLTLHSRRNSALNLFSS